MEVGKRRFWTFRMSNQIFCIFCHFLTNWHESWLISENLNVVANGAGTFLVVTLYGAETFFYCIHTGHEVFLDSHFYGAHTFSCICSTGQYVFWPLYLRGTSFFEGPNSYWPAPFHINFVHSLKSHILVIMNQMSGWYEGSFLINEDPVKNQQ